jgi:drug/metabolite transporter (DMT)-like permease
MNPQTKAILAGIFFGFYPLMLKHSKLGGNMTALLFSLAVFIVIIPFAWKEMATLPNTFWPPIIGAGVVSAFGMLCMVSMIAETPQKNVGILMLSVMVTQAVVTVLYQVVLDRGITLTKVIGFACAGIAIVLLNKK